MTVSFTHPARPVGAAGGGLGPLRPRREIDLPAGRAAARRGERPAQPAPAGDVRARRASTPTDEQVRRARHGYYAAVSYVDARIGEVLGALRESGLAEDTVVLFTADHGELLGERGLWYKMAFFDAGRARAADRVGARALRAGTGGGAGVAARPRPDAVPSSPASAEDDDGDGRTWPRSCAARRARAPTWSPSTWPRACARRW